MPVITLARELGALYSAEEESLGTALNMHCIGKNFLEEQFVHLNMNLNLMRKYDEKKPGVFAALFGNNCDLYLETLRTIIFQQAAKSDIIIVGRSGNILLGGIENVLRLRLTGSKENRVKRLVSEQNCTREHAVAQIENSDRNRAAFCRFHFNEDWYNAQFYDLIINTDLLSFKQLTTFIKQALTLFISEEHERSGAKRLHNLALAQTVRHHIMIEENLGIRFLNIVSNDGCVMLHGIVAAQEIAQRCEKIARKVEGVSKVVNELEVCIGPAPLRKI